MPNRCGLPPAVRVGGLYTRATQPVNTWNGPRENNFARLRTAVSTGTMPLLQTACRTGRCKPAQRPPSGGRCKQYSGSSVPIPRPPRSGGGGGARASAPRRHRREPRSPSGRRTSPSPWRSARRAGRASLRRRRSMPPVPAGIRRPTMTFSLRPSSVSDLAVDGGIGEHARGLLERGRRDEAPRLQRRLGDAEQHGLARCRALAGLLEARLISSNSILSSCSPFSSSVSPASSTSTFCSIWRTITSMCLSLIVTPCSR